MSAPTRRKEDFNYRLPDSFEKRYWMPTRTQLYSTVKGDDRYRSPSLVKPVVFGSLFLLASFVVAYLILGE